MIIIATIICRYIYIEIKNDKRLGDDDRYFTIDFTYLKIIEKKALSDPFR